MLLREWGRPLLSLVGLVVAYYVYPADFGNAPLAVLELIVAAGGLALLGVMMLREVDHLRRGESVRSLPAIAMLVMLVVVGFSMSFFILAENAPDQMAGVETRTDALYFTLSTMTTVGFGDVHATGQFARVMVISLITFNVVVVATLLRGLTARGAQRPLEPPGSP